MDAATIAGRVRTAFDAVGVDDAAILAWTPSSGVAAETIGRLAPDLPVEAGSVTKTVTGLLLAAAVLRGEVSADDPLERYVPRTGPAGVATLASLATHSSGLPRLSARVLVRGLVTHREDPYRDTSLDQLASYARWATVRPSRGPHYSNLGVALLGQALAAAAGTDYWSLARDRVLAPLGMTASGDLPDADVWTAETVWGHGAWAPAGGLRAPVRDLLTLARAAAVPEDSAVPDLFAAVLTPRGTLQGNGIGWCWLLRDAPGRPVAWHNGGTHSAWSFVAGHPRAAVAAAVGERARTAFDRAVLDAVAAAAG
jgi:CubicO group peptidase (beta-lactamase class C family)